MNGYHGSTYSDYNNIKRHIKGYRGGNKELSGKEWENRTVIIIILRNQSDKKGNQDNGRGNDKGNKRQWDGDGQVRNKYWFNLKCLNKNNISIIFHINVKL
jgi:hypothetical protein